MADEDEEDEDGATAGKKEIQERLQGMKTSVNRTDAAIKAIRNLDKGRASSVQILGSKSTMRSE